MPTPRQTGTSFARDDDGWWMMDADDEGWWWWWWWWWWWMMMVMMDDDDDDGWWWWWWMMMMIMDDDGWWWWGWWWGWWSSLRGYHISLFPWNIAPCSQQTRIKRPSFLDACYDGGINSSFRVKNKWFLNDVGQKNTFIVYGFRGVPRLWDFSSAINQVYFNVHPFLAEVFSSQIDEIAEKKVVHLYRSALLGLT